MYSKYFIRDIYLSYEKKLEAYWNKLGARMQTFANFSLTRWDEIIGLGTGCLNLVLSEFWNTVFFFVIRSRFERFSIH